MPKNTIGQFIAILRKANGMTQQDVADRLNVSNKAVSRWERDECSPDLSVIPALAEMFGVTCDELLRGEKNPQPLNEDKREIRAEKQVKSLINRTISGFKIMVWISLTVSVIGLVCMFGISYGFYRPAIGFTVMLLFEACSFALALLAVSKARDIKNYNELFEFADADLIKRYNKVLGSLSYTAFFAVLAVIALSLPLILSSSSNTYSVLTIDSYFAYCFIWVVIFLAVIFLSCKKPYISFITGANLTDKISHPYAKIKNKMNAVQIGLIALASIIFIFAPYFYNDPSDSIFPLICTVIVLMILGASSISFIVFIFKHKPYRKELLIPGIRNIFLIPFAVIIYDWHGVVWDFAEENQWSIDGYTRYDYWDTEYLLYALYWAVGVIAVFAIIEFIRKGKTENR